MSSPLTSAPKSKGKKKKGKRGNTAMLKCANCNFSGGKAQLLDHVIRSHVSTERVPWICSLCGYRAVARNLLNTHERLSIHKNALKRNPDASFKFIKSNNPYLVREGVDYFVVNDNDWGGDDDGGEVRCMKRKGLETNQNRKKIRSDDQIDSRRHNEMFRDRARFDYEMRERPDRPNYDMEDDDFHRYDFHQGNFNSDFQFGNSYNEWSNRQNIQQSIRNQIRFMSNSQNISNNHMDYRSGHRNVDGPFSDNVMSSSDMEFESESFGDNIGFQGRAFESGGGFGSPRMRPRLQSRMAANAMRGNVNNRGSRRRNSPSSPVKSCNAQNQGRAIPSLLDNLNGPILPSPQSPPSNRSFPRSPKWPSEDETPPRVKSDAERAPASSSTLDKPHVQSEAVLKDHPVQETAACQAATTSTSTGDSRVVLCNKNVAQSAEIGSTCGSSKEKGVEEVTSQPEVKSEKCKQTTGKRRFSSGRSSVGEQEQQTPHTVLEEHEDIEHDEDDITDSQILEDKMTDLISALEPLKNISKALIALDHHMRRLLPMVEHLVKDAHASSDKRK